MNIYKFCNKNYLRFFYIYVNNIVNTFAKVNTFALGKCDASTFQ